jgi:hypothetical protein
MKNNVVNIMDFLFLHDEQLYSEFKARQATLSGDYKNVSLCSFERIKGIDASSLNVVWKHEGAMNEGVFRFNDENIGVRPVCIDITTRQLIVSELEDMRPDIRMRAIEGMESSREKFNRMVNLFQFKARQKKAM